MQTARGASLRPGDTRSTSSRRILALFLAVAAVAYVADVLTKIWAVEALTGRAEPVRVVGDLLTFQLVRNPGAAFSTGTSYTLLLSLLAMAAVVTVLWFSRRLGSRLWAVGLGALLGGVLGNLTDRVLREPGFLRGHVVDFIRLPNWPVFNVADICINVAAVVIVVQALRGVSLSGHRDGPGETEPPEPTDR